jgi:hypothetical protein
MELQLSTLSGWRLMRQKSLEQESGPVPQRDRAVSIVECSEKEALYILQSRCWCFRGRNSHVRLCPTILIVKKKKVPNLKNVSHIAPRIVEQNSQYPVHPLPAEESCCRGI